MKTDYSNRRKLNSGIAHSLHFMAGLLVIMVAPLALAAATFQGIGLFPGGNWSSAYRVSGDGTTVVGDASNFDGSYQAIRWTAAGGLQGLGYLQGGTFSSAYGVSADGSVITGDAEDSTGNSPGFRWTQAGGMTALNLLPNSGFNSIYDMSQDGNVIVGYSDGASGGSFRWTPSTGTVDLGLPPAGYSSMNALRVSGDGSVIVGDMTSDFGIIEAYRWTSATGFVGLGFLPNGGGYSSARGVSGDGSAITGDAWDYVGFYWTATGGMLPLGSHYSSPSNLSSDGKVVVGLTDIGTMGVLRWTAGGGSRDLYDVLTKVYGLNLTGWYLYTAEAVSADGSVIVGNGTNPDGVSEGWRAFIPPQVPAAGRILLEGLFDTTFAWTPEVFDPEGNVLTCRLMNPPGNGTATITSDCLSGTYQPSTGFVGTDSFSYVANDGTQDSNVAPVEVAVLAELPSSPMPTSTFTPTPAPSPPPLRNITLHPGLDATVTWVPAFAWDGLTGCSIVNPPLYGTATIAADCRSGTYTPGANYNGQDSFTYIGSYGGTTMNSATVTVSNLTADSLPNGSQLRIDAGVGSAPNQPCPAGSCFGMEVAPGFVVWTDFGPGTLAGLVVGRDQKSGGQELAPSSANNTSGEITNAFLFFGNYGTFFTAPGSSANLFSMTPCVGSSCLGNTELGTWHTAWNGLTIPLGSANGCSHPNCTVDERQGIQVSQWDISFGANNTGPFTLVYNQVVPRGQFIGVPYQLVLRGTAVPAGSIPPAPPIAYSVTAAVVSGTTVVWKPSAVDYNGDPITCFLGTMPAHGTATVKSDCSSGTYTPIAGYVGPDSFTYGANDGTGNSNLAMVSITVLPSPAPTAGDLTLRLGTNTSVAWTPSLHDPQHDALTCRIVSAPSFGTATLASNCTAGTYTPGPGFTGNDSFTYAANDGIYDSNAATVTVTNLPPSALPNISQLIINRGIGSAPNLLCSTGSCFGLEVAPGFVVWTNFGPGTDGGIIVGKEQKSGGQELAFSSSNTTPGELTDAWLFFGNYGTFFTAGGASANLFDTGSCTGAGCVGVTELGTWNIAWNGGIYAMGSTIPCIHAACTPDQINGIFIKRWLITLNDQGVGTYRLEYGSVVPTGQFIGVKFSLILDGQVSTGPLANIPPYARDMSLSTPINALVNWLPAVTDINLDPLTCSITIPPLNGTATVAANCSGGTYTPNTGFVGFDSFKYKANDGSYDSNLATVNIAVGQPTPTFTPTSTFTPTYTATPTRTPTFTPLPNPTAGDLKLRIGTDPTTVWTPVVRDPSNSALTCRIVTAPSFGTATVASDCTAGTYTRGANFTGGDSFTYAANVGIYDSNVAKVTVINLPPSALPNFSQLTIIQGIGSAPNLACRTGSCFGMEVAPGFVVWTDFGPGTDGGIIVGKAQKSGGQELGLSAANTTPGEVTNAWLFFGNYGTFYTAGGTSANLFDTGSCTGAGCVGVTELDTWNVAWNSNIIPLGSSIDCIVPACTTDQQNGIFIKRWLITLDSSGVGTYRLEYGTVVPSGGFFGVKFSLILDGQVSTGPLANLPPYTRDISLSTPINALVNWVPAVTDVNHDPLTCSITNPPLNGTATVEPDCSGGTYTPKAGFVGFDGFKYKANDGTSDSNLGTVSVAIGQPTPTFTATATYTPTGTPSRTPTNTATGTATVTATATGTPRFTPTFTATATFTATGTATMTFTPNFTATPLPGGLLPPGTKLGIMPGVGSTINTPCSSGSCFGMEVAPGFVVWTDFGPGTDGGFIVGKAQKSGGQELGPSSDTITPGELTNASFYFGNYGTFYTSPGGETNLFSNTSCSLSSCLGKTELRVFNIAWNGATIGMGDPTSAAADCARLSTYCINDIHYLVDTSSWSLSFWKIVPSSLFMGVKFHLYARGSVTPATTPNSPPMASNISLAGLYGVTISWKPAVADPDGDLLTCRIGTQPSYGVATVASNCSSGTYTSEVGFVGTDAFTYIANDGKTDSSPGSVHAVAIAPTPIPTPTFTATPTPAGCAGTYPVKQISQTGKDGTLTLTFTGNIISHTKKQVKICPSTRLDYKAVSTKGAVVCKIKNTTTLATGTLKVRDHLKCTDKPAGKDKADFKVKSGVAG